MGFIREIYMLAVKFYVSDGNRKYKLIIDLFVLIIICSNEWRWYFKYKLIMDIWVDI